MVAGAEMDTLAKVKFDLCVADAFIQSDTVWRCGVWESKPDGPLVCWAMWATFHYA